MTALTIRAIGETVGATLGVSWADMTSARKPAPVARARQIAMWGARHWTHHSLPTIGRAFGGRDHTTVHHAVRKVDAMTSDPDVVAAAAAIEATAVALKITGISIVPDIDPLVVAARVARQPASAVLASVDEVQALAAAVLAVEADGRWVRETTAEALREAALQRAMEPLRAAVAAVLHADDKRTLARLTSGERGAEQAFQAALSALKITFEERR